MTVEKIRSRKWTLGIMVSEENCPECGEPVLNHDDYTLIVKYPDGDKVDALGIAYHTRCLED